MLGPEDPRHENRWGAAARHPAIAGVRRHAHRPHPSELDADVRCRVVEHPVTSTPPSRKKSSDFFTGSFSRACRSASDADAGADDGYESPVVDSALTTTGRCVFHFGDAHFAVERHPTEEPR